ncbi:MAG: hypothetical protein WDM80_15105 [Limisphaerales bacterium]
MNNVIKQKSNSYTFYALLILSFQIAATNINAAETCTNCNWLSFGLSIPQTNIIVGDEILVSMICSNISDVEHNLSGLHADACGTGFGEYQIIEMTSGKKFECQISLNNRIPHSYSLNVLKPHIEQSFTNNLAYAYAITNAGSYIVQAAGQFRLHEPKNRQYSTLITPPILITISPKVITNTPSN